MHYPLTRQQAGDEYLTLDEAFDVLLAGFFQLKYKGKSTAHTFKYLTLKRGWMTKQIADEFTDYCIRGWRIV